MMDPGSVFGDYQHIFGLKSNIIFHAHSDKDGETKKS